MRFRPLTKMSANVGPNMTPMVDVVMCILIFFMLGSSLTPELFLRSNTAIDRTGLGDEVTDQKLPSVRVNIAMQRLGEQTVISAFESKPLRMDNIDDPDQSDNRQIEAYFMQKKKTLSDDVQVIIVPDKHVPYQDVITIYDYCTKAQFKQVAFAPAH
ncbi:MAG TPA: biopolymer transporter ExbD [Phycisphaerae bacterium]|nr:biopolymer transporter ExbD [Phycisphaerae bacterium]